MLSIQRLNVHIQGSHILRDVSLEVGARELVCLVGRNGAGKTTILRTVMGYVKATSGTVTFKGEPLLGLPTHAIAARGLGFSPEESGIFGDLTVAENIEMATWTRPSPRAAAERVAAAYAAFPRLRAYARRGGTQLSGGERKMLSVARALALDPEMLLLDEPFEGLSPAIIPTLSESIAAIAGGGQGADVTAAATSARAILIAESNIHHVPDHASRLYVIERGEIIFAGPPAEARRDAAVLKIIGGET